MVATHRCLAALLLLAASCARPPASTGAVEPADVASGPRVARNPLVISREELEDPVIQSMDGYRAIQQLRPTFFRQSGLQSFVDPTAGSTKISQDYGPLQALGQLRWFNVLMLYEVRYLDANEAQGRFGLNANGGPVIVLLTHKP